MNTPGSTLLGWVVLIAAGGGAFYYAKKDIDARRRAQEMAKTRPTEKLEWWQKVDQGDNSKPSATDVTGEISPNTGQISTNSDTNSSGS